MPNILVLGYARHGKDTVCEILRDHYGLKFTSSSMFCAEKVVLPRFLEMEGQGGPMYSDAEQCFHDRGNHREFWYQAISAFNTPDASALGRAIFAENDVYCGLRSKTEFHALNNSRVFDLAIWVDAGDRLPVERQSSCTVEPWMANYVIDNNRDLEHLAFETHRLMVPIMTGRGY